ncbi:redoxin domain-containing protein [bacterium]|nr:redoxin domain-containing protein [bacterium]
MIRSIGSILSVVLLLAIAVLPAQAVEVGETAPEFTLSDTDGMSHSLSDYRGTVVYIMFFGYS